MKPFVEYHKNWLIWFLGISLLLALCSICQAGEPIKASWYSIESLKKEGSWKLYKGVMANGKQFDDNKLTCASRMHDLGTNLLVTDLSSKRTVIVQVTDRIGKRFAQTRIDLSKRAFEILSDGRLDKGLLQVKIRMLK